MKVALVDAETGNTVCSTKHPEVEMEIEAKQPGWAEQHPDLWWENLIVATQKLMADSAVSPQEIQAIGMAYQMHGLVLIDRDGKPLRPSIIWCDSRAVEIGESAFDLLGHDFCLSTLLNSPGNFTAAKLKWVKDNEPDLYNKIDKVLLPGDYINLRLTGQVNTTISGLSEGVFWDFKRNAVSAELMQTFGFDDQLIPEIKDTFGVQGTLTKNAAEVLGLSEGTPVAYRAGDQPNNAMSLGVLKPGEVAATGGTSGVVFGVVDRPIFDSESRVNAFAHVNYQKNMPSIGILLCINGAGIQYSWMRKMLSGGELNYDQIESMVSSVPIGSEGLRILPFGNGAERMLGNQDLGSQVVNLQLNRHGKAHLYRAAIEGVAYSFVYGIELMREMGMSIEVIRVGNDNLFQSSVFSSTIASILNCEIQMIETSGAEGAAKGAGFGVGVYGNLEEVTGGLKLVRSFHANSAADQYRSGYALWKADLVKLLD